MNDKPDLKKVMERIAKLLALSQNNSNEAEAMFAAGKAQALLAEYNLSVSDVQSNSRKEDSFVIDDDLITDSLPWRRQLASMVGKLYFCEYFYTFRKDFPKSRPNGYKRMDIHSFVGEAHNLAVAKIMFKYLLDTIERLANEGQRKWPVNERSKYRTSFKAACANRLCWRINERIEATKKGGEVKTEVGTNLPALASLYDQAQLKIQSYIEQQMGEIKSKEVRHTTSHHGGVMEGHKAGNKIGLDQQVDRKSQGQLEGRK